jgi:hypothetical protein
MPNNNVPLEFSDLFESEPEENEPTDYFEKFVADAQLGAVLGGEQHVIGLEKEIAPITSRAAAIYKTIAKKAATASQVKTNSSAPTLEKRFSPDPRAGYRQFFKDHCANGKTAEQVLDSWLAEFPTANPDCVKLMRSVASEF